MTDQQKTNREALTELIAGHLSGTYHCTRVWSAWNVGTMSQDDFEDVGESDTPTELADAILDSPIFLACDPTPSANVRVPRWHEELIGMVEGNKLFDNQQEYVRLEDHLTAISQTPTPVSSLSGSNGTNKLGQTAIQRAQSDFMEFLAQDGYLDTDRCLEPKSAAYIQTLLDKLCEAARRDLRLELAATIREGISAVADARSAKDSPVSTAKEGE